MFGAEYGLQCYCGNKLRTGSVEVDAWQWGMICEGDVTQACGGVDRLSVLYSGLIGDIATGLRRLGNDPERQV